jgi:hypothetical protein
MRRQKYKFNYMRFCRHCGEYKKMVGKFAHVCPECNKIRTDLLKQHGSIEGNRIYREEILNAKREE